jgi:hypothetical protein
MTTTDAAVKPHCRIGKIRAKNGAELRVLPGLAERNAKEAWTDLRSKVAKAEKHYGETLDGFILIAWDAEGWWSCFHRAGRMRHGNSLADFARGAVQRQFAYEESAQAIEDLLQNK